MTTASRTEVACHANSAAAIIERIYGGGPIITPELRLRAARVERANAIMARAFGPLPATPHGFADPVGFVMACRRSAARERIRIALIHALPLEAPSYGITDADIPY